MELDRRALRDKQSLTFIHAGPGSFTVTIRLLQGGLVGLGRARDKCRWQGEAILAAMREFGTNSGRRPTLGDFCAAKGLHSYGTVRHAFEFLLRGIAGAEAGA